MFGRTGAEFYHQEEVEQFDPTKDKQRKADNLDSEPMSTEENGPKEDKKAKSKKKGKPKKSTQGPKIKPG